MTGIGASFGSFDVNVTLSTVGSAKAVAVLESRFTTNSPATAIAAAGLPGAESISLTGVGRELHGSFTTLQQRGNYTVVVYGTLINGTPSPHWVVVRGILMRDLTPPSYTNVSVGTFVYDHTTDEFTVTITVTLDEAGSLQYGLYQNSQCNS